MKRLIIILAILLSVSSLQAQVNREVEVTRAYIPTVEKAEKPILKAQILDTAYINPDVDYTIMPLAINTQLQSLPIKPATTTYWEFNKPSLAQLKIGAGYPFNTLLQGYISTQNSEVGYLAANVDHVGNFSDLKNNLGDMTNAYESLNSASIAGGLYISDRYSLNGNVGYSNDFYNKYAFEQSASSAVNFQKFGGAVQFGDSFVDLNHLNFSVGAAASYFFDRNNNDNLAFDTEVILGKSVGLGELLFGLDYKYVDSNDDYANQVASLAASFTTKISSWNITLGGAYYYDSTKIDQTKTNHYLIPNIEVCRAKATVIAPFFTLGGDLEVNSYQELAQLNPYLKEGLSAISSVDYNVALGVMGRVASSKIEYKLYAGYRLGFNSRFWGLTVESYDQSSGIYDNSFDLELADLNTTSANLEIIAKPTSKLSLSLDGHYYLYSAVDQLLYNNWRPNFDATLKVDYIFGKVNMGVKANLIGEREFSICYLSSATGSSTGDYTVNLPCALNLGLYVDWSASEKFSLFVEGENLCNTNIYPWPMYRGFGCQVTAGVKLKFR